MRRALLIVLPTLLTFCLSPLARASETASWLDELSMVAIQDGGRVMPMEGYARRLASKITGREHWSEGRGPEAYSGRAPMLLLCDLLFTGDAMVGEPLIGVENKPFKSRVGLEPERRFFTAREIAANKGINDLLTAFAAKQQADPQATAAGDERTALELFNAANTIASLSTGQRLAIVPSGPGQAFLQVGLSGGDPGTQQVRDAWTALADAYAAGSDMNTPTANLRAAIAAVGALPSNEAHRVGLEVFYLRHNPWRMTQIAYGLAIILFGLSRLTLRKPLVWAAVGATVFGVVEHLMGITLRVLILDRAPVSNTFEALLWMGLVAIAIGSAAQVINRRGYYLFGGVCAALLSVLFAGLVPLTDRTNSLPAVLRSNYWLIVHVLTIVASYGVLMVAAVLGHVYLAREVLLRRKGDDPDTEEFVSSNRSHPLIVQTYRTIQVGLLLLTAGTILGGVWAADSWGRFWGWDPKETWALISIVVYFAVLHARYVGWLQDFGLAAASVLGFVVIVWTFYGVNYVMATGLHSYGFGSGGEVWVGMWALAEVLFLVACRVRFMSMRRTADTEGHAGVSTT